MGEHILKQRYDLKMKAVDRRKLLGVDKSTLTKWEQGHHKPLPSPAARLISATRSGRIIPLVSTACADREARLNINHDAAMHHKPCFTGDPYDGARFAGPV